MVFQICVTNEHIFGEFRSRTIVPALFWGVWIAMLPIVGLQMLVVFLIALVVRANLLNCCSSMDFESYKYGSDLFCRLSDRNGFLESAWY